MKVLSYKNLIMRFFFCATGSRLYVMSTGTWHFLLVNYLDLILCILIACPLRLYCIGCLHPQRYFYAWYLMHHSHLHSELVHDLFSFHWNGILQYHPLIDWYYILIPKVCLCSNIMIDKVINHPACSLIHVVIFGVFI